MSRSAAHRLISTAADVSVFSAPRLYLAVTELVKSVKEYTANPVHADARALFLHLAIIMHAVVRDARTQKHLFAHKKS